MRISTRSHLPQRPLCQPFAAGLAGSTGWQYFAASSQVIDSKGLPA